MNMNDKEFFEGELECPVYGEGCKPEFCIGCEIGNDTVAGCPFRMMPYGGGSDGSK